MKAYIVGGAVRDRLLGLPVADRDWVVVGATPEQMVGAGYKPVGRDFPVFLHPATGEEYALARTERKSGRGYHGFVFHASPEVTLEDDLARRDLTINAIAEDPDTGALIDPFDGRADLERKRLRHVSPAFVEDPVRLLRCARFAARFADFEIAQQTLALMRRLVEAGEVDALVPERVWQELARGLMEDRPDRMLQVLRDCGALVRLLPEVDAVFDTDAGAHLARALRLATQLDAPLSVRYAVLCLDLDPGGSDASRRVALAAQVGERWRVDNDCRALAEMAAREHEAVHGSAAADAAALMALFDRCDAWRRPQRFADLLLACECDARARPGDDDADYLPRQRLAAALAAALAADVHAASAEAIAAGLTGPDVGLRVRAARQAALSKALAAGSDAPGPASWLQPSRRSPVRTSPP
jgi:tRNA nucleotidyltransferase (CCA-adding enzyme)